MFILRHHTVLLTLLILLLTLSAAHTVLAQNTITVNTTADNTDANDGACTLREALLNANANTDTTSGDCDSGSGTDTIAFSIDGAGPHVITPRPVLPEITDPVVIDGSTQPDNEDVCTAAISARPAYAIVLDGNTRRINGLVLGAGSDGSTIRGLNIRNFGTNGIEIDGSGNNTLVCNFIGTDEDGDTDIGNRIDGLHILGGTGNNIIGGTMPSLSNLIAGNNRSGIRVDGADASTIQGNVIGLNAAGTATLGNTVHGIHVLSGAAGTIIGGAADGARNIVSGNGTLGAGDGIILSDVTGSLVQGNIVGTDASGTIALGNGRDGVVLLNSATNNTIGGVNAGEGNLISGNLRMGIAFFPPANNNTIQGNYIGTNAAGDAALGNGASGISFNTSASNLIGGATAGARNVISGNGSFGVAFFNSTSTMIQGNYIGTNAAGDAALPNEEGGMAFSLSTNTTIGGANPGEGNLISGNIAHGIQFASSSNDTVIQGNYIGTNAAGDAALPNTFQGIAIFDDSDDAQIGGTASGAGNLISGNGSSGILLNDTDIEGTVIAGNRIGTNAAGTAALSNMQHGIFVIDAVGTRIGGAAAGARNIISGNIENGILIGTTTSETTSRMGMAPTNTLSTSIRTEAREQELLPSPQVTFAEAASAGYEATTASALARTTEHSGVPHAVQGTTDATIQGNYIGTNAAGDAALPNGTDGVILISASNNLIGGPAPGEGNLISGNADNGVDISNSDATGNRIEGNRIGTNAAGEATLPNESDGVEIYFAPGNTVGGTAAGTRNLISGNGGAGIDIFGPSADDNLVQGNYVGTNTAGDAALPNATDGIRISFGSGNLVGGTASGASNLVSGNTKSGVLIQGIGATSNRIEGNRIGTDAAGTAALPNGEHGVAITGGATDNTVGGTAAGAGNTIAFNLEAGVIDAGTVSTGTAILSNSIFENGALGIDLGSDGITANDGGDSDDGPNKLQNTPELSSFTLDNADNVLLDYFVDSNPANQTYPLRIEFFLVDADNQEGQTLFTIDAYSETDYNGCGAPPCPKTLNLGPSEGILLVATATDADGNTSEFATDFLADLELGVKVEKTESAEVVLLFSVQNHGTTASRPTIKIELPEGLLFQDADGPGSYNSSGGKWKPGTLAAGSSVGLALTLRRLSTEELAISARITKATVPDPLVDNNSVVLVLEAVASAQFSEQNEVESLEPEALSATESLPEAFALSSNYPNPFNPETTIPFAVPEASLVTLAVYDVTGRRVAVLVEGQMAAGRHEVQFRADALPSGLYLVRMQAGSFSQVRRMTLVK